MGKFQMLSREELKEINGGSGGGYCQRYCYVTLNGNTWIYGDTQDIPCVTTADCPDISFEDCGTQYGEVWAAFTRCRPLW